MGGKGVLATGLSLRLMDDLVVRTTNGNVDIEETTFDDLENDTWEAGKQVSVNNEKMGYQVNKYIDRQSIFADSQK